MRKCPKYQNSYPSGVNNNDQFLPLDLIFTDIWGPAPMTFAHGSRFYILFVDKQPTTTGSFRLNGSRMFRVYLSNSRIILNYNVIEKFKPSKLITVASSKHRNHFSLITELLIGGRAHTYISRWVQWNGGIDTSWTLIFRY